MLQFPSKISRWHRTTTINKTRQQPQVRYSRSTSKLLCECVTLTTPFKVAVHGNPYFYVLHMLPCINVDLLLAIVIVIWFPYLNRDFVLHAWLHFSIISKPLLPPAHLHPLDILLVLILELVLETEGWSLLTVGVKVDLDYRSSLIRCILIKNTSFCNCQWPPLIRLYVNIYKNVLCILIPTLLTHIKYTVWL